MFSNLRKLRKKSNIKAIDIAKKNWSKTESAYYKKEAGTVPLH